MEQDAEVTKVIFRQFKHGNREVIALFPELPGNSDPGTCMSYLHIGQHGSADALLIVECTRLAYPGNYAALKEELESIGYKLQIYRRFSATAYPKRRAALKAMEISHE